MDEENVVSTEEVAQEVEEPKAEETEQEEVSQPPRKKTAQERIDELTRKRRDAERDVEYWRNKALKEEPPKSEPAPQTSASRPTLDQFDTTEAYEDALFAWRDKKKELEAKEAERQQTVEKATRSFNDRAKELKKEYDDFDEVVEQPIFSEPMRLALLHSEHGPTVAYHLGTHVSEAERIRSLPLELQMVEIGRLETKLLLSKKVKKTTEAPPPISPVGMAGNSDTDPSKMSTAEWMEWDRNRERERLKKKYG